MPSKNTLRLVREDLGSAHRSLSSDWARHRQRSRLRLPLPLGCLNDVRPKARCGRGSGMQLHLEWGRPIKLRDASKDNMIYSVDIERVRQARVSMFSAGDGVSSSKLCTWGKRATASEVA